MMPPMGSYLRLALLRQAARGRNGVLRGGRTRTGQASTEYELLVDLTPQRQLHAEGLQNPSRLFPSRPPSTLPRVPHPSLPFALGTRQHARFYGTRPEPEIPGFFESLWASVSSTDGQMFLFGVLGLTGAAMLGDRILTERSHGHTPDHSDPGQGAQEDPAIVTVVEVAPDFEEREEPDPVAEAVLAVEVIEEPLGAETVADPEEESNTQEDAQTPAERVEEAVQAVVEDLEAQQDAMHEGKGEGAGADEGEGKGDDCPFCKFMRAGPCGEQFTAWEACVDSADAGKEDMVEKCLNATHDLKTCMEANEEYYGVILEAERSLLEKDPEAEHVKEGEQKGDIKTAGEGDATDAKASDGEDTSGEADVVLAVEEVTVDEYPVAQEEPGSASSVDPTEGSPGPA